MTPYAKNDKRATRLRSLRTNPTEWKECVSSLVRLELQPAGCATDHVSVVSVMLELEEHTLTNATKMHLCWVTTSAPNRRVVRYGYYETNKDVCGGKRVFCGEQSDLQVS